MQVPLPTTAAPTDSLDAHPRVSRALWALRRWPDWAVYLVAVGGAAAIGAIDWLTGPEVLLTAVYLIPIVLVSWSRGLAPGLAMGLLGLLVMLVLELQGPRTGWGVTLVNAAVRSGMFAFVAFMVSTLRSLLEHLTALSLTDGLTGLANGRSAYVALERELGRLRRSSRPLTVLYLDADRFKEVNDRMGHAAGDEVLRRVGHVLRSRLRETDLAARMGGDEFLVVLPDTDGPGAGVLGEALRSALLEQMRAGGWPVTFSVGAVTFAQAPADVDAVVREVDAAMYEVKATTKDSLRLARWPRAGGPEGAP